MIIFLYKSHLCYFFNRKKIIYKSKKYKIINQFILFCFNCKFIIKRHIYFSIILSKTSLFFIFYSIILLMYLFEDFIFYE